MYSTFGTCLDIAIVGEIYKERLIQDFLEFPRLQTAGGNSKLCNQKGTSLQP